MDTNMDIWLQLIFKVDKDAFLDCKWQKISKASIFWAFLAFICLKKLKTVHEIFCPRWAFLNPLTRYLKAFQNLISILKTYSQFLIDSPLQFEAESRYFSYCLKWRVATPCHIPSGELHIYELCAEILGCHFIQKVNTLWIVYNGESLLPESFVAGSHSWQRGVTVESGEYFFYFEGLPPSYKGYWSKKIKPCI